MKGFIFLDSTDGQLAIRPERVILVVTDPTHPESSMIHLDNGTSFEVSGDRDQVTAALTGGALGTPTD